MTTCGSDILVADDFDAVMAIIDADMLENDTEILSEVNSVVENLPLAKNSGQYHCHICSKICLSESGLLRHVKSKHPENLSSNEESSKLKYSLDIFLLKSFIEKSDAKLVEDACYPEDVMGKFKNFKISSVDDILPAYNLMLSIIKSFNGDPEKSTHSSIRPLVLQKIFTKISVVTVVSSLVLKLQIMY